MNEAVTLEPSSSKLSSIEPGRKVSSTDLTKSPSRVDGRVEKPGRSTSRSLSSYVGVGGRALLRFGGDLTCELGLAESICCRAKRPICWPAYGGVTSGGELGVCVERDDSDGLDDA